VHDWCGQFDAVDDLEQFHLELAPGRRLRLLLKLSASHDSGADDQDFDWFYFPCTSARNTAKD